MDSANHLSLVFYEEDSLQMKILFKPLSNPNLSTNSDIVSILKKQSWKFSKSDMEDEPDSRWLFENDTLSILILNTDTATYSTPVNWRIVEEFVGHYFLFFRHSYMPFYVHLIDLQNGNNLIIATDFYALNEYPFETEYPNNFIYCLAGSYLPIKTTISNTSNSLNGTWKSIDDAFPVDHMYSNQEFLSSFFTYEFRKDGTVSTNFGREVRNNYRKYEIDSTETSKWSLASIGNLIIFDKAYSSRNLAHFRFIDSNTIEVQKEMRSLEGHLIDNMIFRMKRGNN